MSKIILCYPKLEKDVSHHWFPYSILSIAINLSEKGHEVVILDKRVEEKFYEKLSVSIKEALCVGISAMSGYQIKDGLEIARFVRRVAKDLRIIWGGWHATILPEETLEHELVDFIVAGRGHDIFTQLVHKFETRKNDFGNIKGLGFKLKGKTYFTGYSQSGEIIDNALMYDRFIVPDKYRNPETNAVGYFSAHGCVFKCAFCSRHFMTHTYYHLELNKVLQDIKYFVYNQGFRTVYFQDDTFFINKNRVMQLCRALIRNKLNIQWKANARANSLIDYSSEELGLLVDSGLFSLFIGAESGDQKLLNMMNKQIQVNDVVKSAEIIRQYDIQLQLSYIVGLPGDKPAYLRKTNDQIKHILDINQNVCFQICFYQPFPGTTLYQKALSIGYPRIKGLENWAEMKPQYKITERLCELHRFPWLSENEMGKYEKLLVELLENRSRLEALTNRKTNK